MTRTRRTILAILLVEAILAGIWLYLANMGLERPDSVAPDFQRTLGSTMGAAMGALLGLGILLLVIARKADRGR